MSRLFGRVGDDDEALSVLIPELLLAAGQGKVHDAALDVLVAQAEVLRARVRPEVEAAIAIGLDLVSSAPSGPMSLHPEASVATASISDRRVVFGAAGIVGAAPATVAVGDLAGLLGAEERAEGDVGEERGEGGEGGGAGGAQGLVNEGEDGAGDRLGGEGGGGRLMLKALPDQLF